METLGPAQRRFIIAHQFQARGWERSSLYCTQCKLNIWTLILLIGGVLREGWHQYGRKWSHQWPVLFFLLLKETEERPQASVTFAVIQCDFQKPTISWACCFCTTNCFHSQSWEESCHPWRRHKSDVLSNWIFSPWWEHRRTWDKANSWHLIRLDSLSPQKTSLWCSGPHIRVPMFSYHGHHLSHIHTPQDHILPSYCQRLDFRTPSPCHVLTT